MEVALPIVRYEEGSNGAVWIVCAEIAVASVESTELAARSPRFENRPPWRRVSQLLSEAQIFLLANIAELCAMFAVVFVKLRPAAKSRAARAQQHHRQRQTDDRPKYAACCFLHPAYCMAMSTMSVKPLVV